MLAQMHQGARHKLQLAASQELVLVLQEHECAEAGARRAEEHQEHEAAYSRLTLHRDLSVLTNSH